jgi:hypothetical protein
MILGGDDRGESTEIVEISARPKNELWAEFDVEYAPLSLNPQ